MTRITKHFLTGLREAVSVSNSGRIEGNDFEVSWKRIPGVEDLFLFWFYRDGRHTPVGAGKCYNKIHLMPFKKHPVLEINSIPRDVLVPIGEFFFFEDGFVPFLRTFETSSQNVNLSWKNLIASYEFDGIYLSIGE